MYEKNDVQATLPRAGQVVKKWINKTYTHFEKTNALLGWHKKYKKALPKESLNYGDGEMKENNKNRHIKEYIERYITFSNSPHFAVMISGPWGVGKTHLVKEVLNNKNTCTYIYVSMYGASATEEIDLALLHANYPILKGRAGSYAGKLGKAALKYFRLDGIIKAKDFKKNNQDKIYVFDDIERCTLPASSALGYINEMVEHDGCKVIIIANEEKLLKDPNYKETREKLIGRTLEVQPETKEITRNIINAMPPGKAKTIAEENSPSIELIFKEAKTKSFRVLQQAIWDFESIANCLDNKHLENKEGTKELIKLFLAIALEFKSGEIEKEDISSRPNELMKYSLMQGTKKTDSKLEQSNKRFSDTNLYSTILSNKILSDLLSKGQANEGDIKTCINNSSHYIKLKEEPAWQILWHAHEREDNDVDRAIEELNSQLEKEEIEDFGIILHVVGIQLWLSSMGKISDSRADITRRAKVYADTLYKKKRIQPLPISQLSTDLFQGCYGLGIHEHDSLELKEITTHYTNLSEQAKIDKYPEQAQELLEEMLLDPGQFYRRINYTNNSEENIYTDIPILSAIDPKVFSEKLLQLHPKERGLVLAAINSRHSVRRRENPIKSEIPWISKLEQELSTAAASLSVTQKWGLLNSTGHYLKPLISDSETET